MICLGSNQSVRLMASAALAAAFAFPTAGCTTTQPMETTGTLGIAAAPRSDADWRRSAEAWGDRYRANPSDPEAAINYAQALRGMGQRAQAAAVLEQASIQNPKHTGIAGAYGRALADTGNYKQALEVLNRAHAPDQPDWRILSVQGAVLDQVGRHDEARNATTRPRCGSCRTSPRFCPISGCPTRWSKDLVRAEVDAAAGRRRGAPMRACGRTSRWWSDCRDASPKPRPSRAPTCRRRKPPPTWPICGRCWRSRTVERAGRAEQAAGAPPGS